jgi:hypothetical protein
MARLFRYLVEYYGRARTMRFLQNVSSYAELLLLLCSIIALFRSHGRISLHTWRRLLTGPWSARSSKYLQLIHRMNMSPLTLTHLCEERQTIL